MKTFKVMMPLLLVCLILAACSELKLGDTFMLDRAAVGGVTINSEESLVREERSLQEREDAPDSAGEHLDLSEIASFSGGTVVRVTDFSGHMVQIRNMKPKAHGMKIWLSREKLKKAM